MKSLAFRFYFRTVPIAASVCISILFICVPFPATPHFYPIFPPWQLFSVSLFTTSLAPPPPPTNTLIPKPDRLSQQTFLVRRQCYIQYSPACAMLTWCQLSHFHYHVSTSHISMSLQLSPFSSYSFRNTS